MRTFRKHLMVLHMAALLTVAAVVLPAARAAAPAPATPSAAIREDDNIVYGQAGGQALLLDVIRPAARPGKTMVLRPALLFVHGGGWQSGSRKDFTGGAEGMARLGYVCFTADYRLSSAGKNPYPAALDDVQRAVRWIRANARKYGVDPNRIGAVGASAGGHLVALLGTRDTRDPVRDGLSKYSSRVRCVVDMFGPTDLTATFPGKPLDVRALLTAFLGQPPEAAPALYRDASPLFHVDKRSAPFFIYHGTDDPLVPLDQSRRLHAALRKAGVESTLLVLPGEGHGVAQPEHVQKFVRDVTAFLARHLKPPR